MIGVRFVKFTVLVVGPAETRTILPSCAAVKLNVWLRNVPPLMFSWLPPVVELLKLMVGTVTRPPELSIVRNSPLLPLIVTLVVVASGWLATTVPLFCSSRLVPLTISVRFESAGAS